ncbi:fructosamine kinase [Gymnopus androsaceus JB14]|uniref:protein-ribulosamine 3-kinase n=1 Tax=Gymnopus androsaceus JB14 TaxID=1447944 RepID=A0A6A4HQ41_9AGAR|nr:fructosamine kinase [Gymnopus androsaceus JB14]
MPLPLHILNELAKIEPAADFTGVVGGRVQSSNGKVYFVKQGSRSEGEQYIGETESLKEIDLASPGLAPKVFSAGDFEDETPFFISEYKDIGHLDDKSATVLAKRLATELHAHTSPKGFGFKVPTFCGATRMKNGWFNSWEECYSEMIGPLKIEPVLLHGDLWSGNVGSDRDTGEPVVFDPSSYFGHNEADLAIARIFGGFPPSFFAEYHKHLPKTEPADQFSLRGHLYELFHYLNHTVLFGGGGYESSALRKMDILTGGYVAGKCSKVEESRRDSKRVSAKKVETAE